MNKETDYQINCPENEAKETPHYAITSTDDVKLEKQLSDHPHNAIEINGSFTSPVDHPGIMGANLEFNLRIGFIRKVYGILTAQLLFTVLICIIPMTSESFRDFQREQYWLLIVFAILPLFCSIALVCFRNVAKQVPYNYILLFAFTVAEAYIVSFICSFYDPVVVLSAALITCGILAGLTAYACCTKTDFTYLGGFLMMALFGLIFWGFIVGVVRNDILISTYSVLGAILYGFYLIYDTQLIVGGKKYELSIDDYIIGALMLYIDTIQIFLYILSLLGRRSD